MGAVPCCPTPIGPEDDRTMVIGAGGAKVWSVITSAGTMERGQRVRFPHFHHDPIIHMIPWAADPGSSCTKDTSLSLRHTTRWSPSFASSTIPKPHYPHLHTSLLTDVLTYALIPVALNIKSGPHHCPYNPTYDPLIACIICISLTVSEDPGGYSGFPQLLLSLFPNSLISSLNGFLAA